MENKKNVQLDVKKAINHLQQKWSNKPCPMCGNNIWTVADKIYELHEFHGGAIVLGSGSILPVFPVTCKNCGNTVFVNGIISGVVEPNKSETNVQ